MGPHTFNFKDICAALAGRRPDHRDRRGFAGKEVETLLTDEDYRRYYGRHAVEVLYQNQERCSACCSC